MLKELFRPLYYLYEFYRIKFLYKLKTNKIDNARDIPIIINNRNRLTFLKRLISSLECRGLTNIYILDNDSTYPPLIEYYKNIKYDVFFLGQNLGHLALWKTDIYKKFCNDYYVYTDSDLEIIDECPVDFLDCFLEVMRNKPKVMKIGLGLKINDLPDHFENKENVINWEKNLYTQKVDSKFYIADVDTTFALYRPYFLTASNNRLCMFRSGYPYEIRHLPWYVDSKNLSEEEAFYVSTAMTSTHWTKKNNKQS